MKVEIRQGAVGQPAGVHWGQTDAGEPVLAIVSSGVMVRVVMTPAEAKDHGCAASYMALAAVLAAPPAANGAGPRAASSLVTADGLPLVGGGRG